MPRTKSSDETTEENANTQKQSTWLHALRESRGHMAVRWPAGQLLCPHYGVWDTEQQTMKLYIPRGGGVIKTGDDALTMITPGITSKHAQFVPTTETPFTDTN